jgi:glycosyltransferase involved in cell wall biosynthesis
LERSTHTNSEKSLVATAAVSLYWSYFMSASLRILIISSGNPCRNPRPVKEAETLGRAGYDVTLLTPGISTNLASIDRELTASGPYRHEAVAFRSGVCSVVFRKLKHRLALHATSLGLQSVHALGPADPLMRRANAFNADLTIVHNEIPFWIGCQLLRRGRRVAADFEDWHSEDLLPVDRRNRPLRLLRAVEAELMCRAAYKSTTSAALSQALASRYAGTAPIVLTNSFPLQSNPRLGEPGTPPAFFWFSQTLGPGRGLEAFIETWTQTTQPSRLVLVGESRSGYERKLFARLPAAFAARVSVQALVTPTQLPSLIAQHDIGLALEQSSIVNRDLTITNKILQYLNAGLAIVATPTAGQCEVLRRAPGVGLCIDFTQPHQGAAALDIWLRDPAALRQVQRTARSAAESIFSWEREAPKLLAAVSAALGSVPK